MKKYKPFDSNKGKRIIYNQNISNKFSADCTVFTMLQILGNTYDVWTPYTLANKIVDYFIKIGTLMKFGAYFSVIYPAMAKLISIRIKTTVEVFKSNINGATFERYLLNGYSFGIGLKYGNKHYLKCVKAGKITKEDIDIIAENKGGFGHNNCYLFKGGKGYIHEIYKGKAVELSLDVLRYGVKKGVFYAPARTFKLKDKDLEEALFNYKNRVVINDVQKLPKKKQDAIWRASQLRISKK